MSLSPLSLPGIPPPSPETSTPFTWDTFPSLLLPRTHLRSLHLGHISVPSLGTCPYSLYLGHTSTPSPWATVPLYTCQFSHLPRPTRHLPATTPSHSAWLEVTVNVRSNFSGPFHHDQHFRRACELRVPNSGSLFSLKCKGRGTKLRCVFSLLSLKKSLPDGPQVHGRSRDGRTGPREPLQAQR